jgi:hypothetical protein
LRSIIRHIGQMHHIHGIRDMRSTLQATLMRRVS